MYSCCLVLYHMWLKCVQIDSLYVVYYGCVLNLIWFYEYSTPNNKSYIGLLFSFYWLDTGYWGKKKLCWINRKYDHCDCWWSLVLMITEKVIDMIGVGDLVMSRFYSTENQSGGWYNRIKVTTKNNHQI